LEKSGRAWKKVACLEKSGHFLEKSGIDVEGILKMEGTSGLLGRHLP
jgi:hypothetical protein